MQWISVKDSLPPDYVEVLYFSLFEGISSEIMTGHREQGIWTHCCMFYSTLYLHEKCKVTHWMPLPDYPKTLDDPLHPDIVDINDLIMTKKSQDACRHDFIHWNFASVLISLPPKYQGKCYHCEKVFYEECSKVLEKSWTMI